MGRDGYSLGHQSHRGPNPCAPLHLAKPLNAEEIAETLGVARSNVSNSLHELQSWRIVKLIHVLGDKRDHFSSMKDVWAKLPGSAPVKCLNAGDKLLKIIGIGS